MFVRVRSTDAQLTHLIKLKGIQTFQKGRQVEMFIYCAMSVYLVPPGATIMSEGLDEHPGYVIVSDDVQLLCESFLIQRICRHNAFSQYKFLVTVHRAYDDAPSLPQRRLLEPFTVLYNSLNFEIVGSVSPEYGANVVARVSRPSPTMEERFDEIADLQRKGRRHFIRKDFEGAMECYRIAYAQLNYSIVPRMVLRPDWVALHPDKKNKAYITRLALRYDLAASNFQVREFNEARYWIYHPRLLDWQLRPWNWEPLRVSVVYLRAAASAFLGESQRGVRELWFGLGSVRPEVYEVEVVSYWRDLARSVIRGATEYDDQRILTLMGF